MTNWVTYKNRKSENYRFSTTDRNDPAIAELKEMIKNENKWIRRFNNNQPTLSLRIRPRGPRNGHYHDTPMANATHYDIYIKQNYDYS